MTDSTELIARLQHDYTTKDLRVMHQLMFEAATALAAHAAEIERLTANVDNLNRKNTVTQGIAGEAQAERDTLRAQLAAAQGQEPFTPDWSQDSAAAESIREHQVICNLLLKEMRHIAGISTGQVKRVAEQALEAVKQAQPEPAEEAHGQHIELYNARLQLSALQARLSEVEGQNQELADYANGLETRTHEARKRIDQLDYELRKAIQDLSKFLTNQEAVTYTPPKIVNPDAPHPCFN